MEEIAAKEKCTEALNNPIPDREKLIEALRLAIEYGFPDVVKTIVARGHSDLLEECGRNVRAGGIKSDGSEQMESEPCTAEVSSVPKNKAWIQERTNYYSKPWSEVEEENGPTNGPKNALNIFNTFMEFVKNMEKLKVLEAMKTCGNQLHRLIMDLSSETQEQSESRMARIKFLQIILDKTYICKNQQVDTTILVDVCTTTECVDGQDTGQTLYQAIAGSNIEELKCHPCFAAVVNKKWMDSYYRYLHSILLVMFILFLVSLTTALALAARSSDPRQYHGAAGGVQGLCEALTLLYLLLTAVFFTMRHVHRRKSYTLAGCNSYERHIHKLKYICCKAWKLVTWDDTLKVCGRLSILLIIPLRAAGNPWQWLFASVAIICNGQRVFYYISVFSCTGHYVATLSILVKRDLQWIILVFLVLNFSLGGGLYFAVVFFGENITNGMNTTSEIYTVWQSGFRVVTGGNSSEPGGWFPVIVYLVFVFTIGVIFTSIVVAQFTTTYGECLTQGKVHAVLCKNGIMQKMDDTINCCRCCNKIMQKMEDIIHSCQCRISGVPLSYAEQVNPGDERSKYLKIPYTPGEVDCRSASVCTMEMMQQDIIVEMERKFKGLRKLMGEPDET